ncbi:GtrA family protein [Halolamina litorea]|uniref:GtrA family protein n=1 Tax=Halolamina litorea TaxID=1515593 RepID=A0ABD6BND8_9EURY|nr:GtrA family protein [Halolamina litorea]
MRLLPDELVAPERFGQFVSVGVVGAAFDLAVSTGMRELGVYPELAVFVGIEVAVVVMFLLNDNWTFAERGVDGLAAGLRRLARSNLVRIGGILVQLGTFSLLYRAFGVEWTLAGLDAWFVVSKVGGIGVGMVVNYVAESLFTWRVTTE